MKVLHYIPLLDKARDYLGELADNAGGVSEHAVYISTLWAERTYQSSGRFVIYQMLKKPHRYVNLIHLQNRFLQILYATMPDIVHIHGCWSYVTAKICLWAKKRNFKVVVSPHGQLGEKVIEDHFWSKRLPSILLYQRRAIKRADALWAGSEQEVKDLKRLGWNKRIGLQNKDRDDMPVQASRYAFYQKVADTAYYSDMHEHEKTAFCALLHAGLADAGEPHLLDGNVILNLRSLPVASWRRIFLLAQDQHVNDILVAGIGRMQLSTPRIDAQSIPRFPRRRELSDASLSDAEFINSSKRKRRLMNKITDNDQCRLYVMLENIRQLLKSKRLSTLQLADYYTQVRHAQLDELQLQQVFHNVGIYPFAGRMHQILHECLYLEYGFMPVPPCDDRKTERIRKRIHQLYHD